MNELEKRLAAMSPEQRDLFLQKLRHKRTAHIQKIEAVSRDQELPLSFTQERQWVLSQLAPDSLAYNMPANVRIRYPLDEALLKQAFDALIQRHEILRTTFPTHAGRPTVRIAQHADSYIPIHDLRELPYDQREAEAKRLANAEMQQPFDLEHGPLIRLTFIRLDAADHVLLLTLHHIIGDAHSVGILFQELSAILEAFEKGLPSPLPPLTVQYADYAAWQRQYLQAAYLEKGLAYWREHLAQAPALLTLPLDRPRLQVQDFHSGTAAVRLDKPTVERLKQIAQQQDATLFMLLLAALNLLLTRYSGQKDIVIGSTLSNRDLEETENMIGYLVNMVALRTSLHGNPSFLALLQRVRETVLGCFTHQHIPLQLVLEELQPERAQSYTPLFQVSINLIVRHEQQEANMPESSIFFSRSGDAVGTGQLDLAFSLVDLPQDMAIKVVYDASIFNEATIQYLLEYYKSVLQAIAATPDAPVHALVQLSPAQQDHVLHLASPAQQAVLAFKPVHALIQEQAQAQPDAIALIAADQHFTYAELNQQANRLAHMVATYAGVGARIALCLERSPEFIISTLAALKSGAAYVPLDPAYPHERLASMIRQSDVAVVLTQRRYTQHLPELDIPVLYLDDIWASLTKYPATDPDWSGHELSPAYMIFTSGSTGTPKAIVVEQQGLSNLVQAAAQLYEVSDTDRVLQFASVSFDTSIEEIFPCLACGATLVLRNDAMLSSAQAFFTTCTAWGITVVDLPTAYWHELVAQLQTDHVALPPTLRLVIVGGERVHRDPVHAWLSYAPSLRLVNSYGPTETTVIATTTELSQQQLTAWGEPPIGTPIPGMAGYVLDTELQLMGVGVPGELFVSGVGVAQGYFGRADLTAQRFLPNPFTEQPGARMYKTGDLVRWRADHTLEFLGRIDRQVKIRGYRVELDEVEAVLMRLPFIQEAAVTIHKKAAASLVGYVTLHDQADISTQAIRQLLQQHVPVYMVPAHIMVLPAFPLTTHGKINYRALPDPDSAAENQATYVAPTNVIEETLADIWTEVLPVAQVGIHDNFFSLGGHSLLATQLIFRVNQAFELNLQLRTLFEAPTVAGFAVAVEQALIDQIEQLSDEEAEQLLNDSSA